VRVNSLLGNITCSVWETLPANLPLPILSRLGDLILSIDLKNIASLRIAIARCGEMDRLRWWNTKGLLGPVGELAISRGFPGTHLFARARSAFSVAAARSDEIFNPPDSYTLWRLPAVIEDQFEDAWAGWLEQQRDWKSILEHINQIQGPDILTGLKNLQLISNSAADRAARLRRADDLRSVPIKTTGESANELIQILAAAHSCSEPGKLAVPYIRVEDFPE
jgi:hypothetical protein